MAETGRRSAAKGIHSVAMERCRMELVPRLMEKAVGSVLKEFRLAEMVRRLVAKGMRLAETAGHRME